MPAEDVRDAVRKEVESRRTTIHTLQEEIARLHSVYNLAAPINSLPPELLGMAFSHLGIASTRKADLVSATHVCRHWRDVALHDPALWAHVGHKHPEGVKTFLQRSKALPVDVTLVTPELPFVATAIFLTAEIHRMRSLCVSIPPSVGLRFIFQSLKSATPQLEKLSITQRRSPPNALGAPQFLSSEPPTEFDGAPTLRSLTLHNVPLPYLPKGPSVLTNLDLKESVIDSSLLLDLLERSPSLVNLRISGTFNIEGLQSQRTVALRHLETFTFEGHPLRGIGNFLLSLVLPKQTTISLSNIRVFHGDEFAHIIPAYDPLTPRFTSLQGLKRLELAWKEPDGLTMRAYRSSDFLAPVLHIKTGPYPDPLRLSERFFVNWPIDASQLDTLVLCGDPRRHNSVTPETWAAMLAAVPLLKTLRVMSVSTATLRWLSGVLAQERAHPLCAQLETLELFDVNPPRAEFWDVMKDVVIARSPTAGGRLSEVELFNTGPATWGAADALLISNAGVRLVQDLD
ncbi:hypothetical protein VTO73DRAFT_14418 [Trametes versicolor]